MSSFEISGWLGSSFGAGSFFFSALGFAAAALGSALALGSAFGAGAATSAALTSNCSKRMDSAFTGVPAVRLQNVSESSGIAFGGVPSFLKMASAATGMKGAKKCANTYTDSRSSRRHAARFGCCSGVFIFHGSKSAIHLFVAADALTVSSAPSLNRYSEKARFTAARNSAKLKGGGTNVKSASGTEPPASVTARCTRLPRLSASSALCIRRMDS
mmetsp:Transcript_44398/g.117801  ORF Transcript_44398/g.117801 Transcript_44398/m.117801 type:complete len:215 (+) Transcript_44398:637-1281(+)